MQRRSLGGKEESFYECVWVKTQEAVKSMAFPGRLKGLANS